MFAFIIIFVISLFGQSATDYPYTLKQVQVKHDVLAIQTADMDQDGPDEYLMTVAQPGTKSALRLYDDDLHRIFFHKNFNSEIISFKGFTEDSLGKIAIAEKNGKAINLLIINAATGTDTLAFMPLYQLQHRATDVGILYIEPFDVNKDGHLDLLLNFTSGLHAEIRALWAVDIYNRSVLWKYDLAPSIIDFKVIQLGDTQDPLILISSQSPGNGHSINGTSDSKSYGVILNAVDGSLVFLKELGGWPSRTLLDVVHTSDGTKLYSFTSGQNLKEGNLSRMLLWNSVDYSVEKHLSNLLSCEEIHCNDLDKDGIDEFIRSGHDNTLDIYNDDLKLQKSFALPGMKNQVLLAADLDNDGET